MYVHSPTLSLTLTMPGNEKTKPQVGSSNYVLTSLACAAVGSVAAIAYTMTYGQNESTKAQKPKSSLNALSKGRTNTWSNPGKRRMNESYSTALKGCEILA
jgi:hypothetical protein